MALTCDHLFVYTRNPSSGRCCYFEVRIMDIQAFYQARYTNIIFHIKVFPVQRRYSCLSKSKEQRELEKSGNIKNITWTGALCFACRKMKTFISFELVILSYHPMMRIYKLGYNVGSQKHRIWGTRYVSIGTETARLHPVCIHPPRLPLLLPAPQRAV